jgi:tetratricopeptide (TPR) repeat protein
MKYSVLILLLIFVPSISGQGAKPKQTAVKKPAAAKPKPATMPVPTPTPTPTPLSEAEQFEKASAYELAADRVAALERFLADFPQSSNRMAAVDLMSTSRTLIAEEHLIQGNAPAAVDLYKVIVRDVPRPVPAELFKDSIAKIPSTLFRYGQRVAAVELAGLIEAKVEDDTAQLLEVANFHLSIENGSEAMRVAAKAAAKDPASPAVHRTLALVHRINFDLEASMEAYAKALEIDPESSAARRGLAEMKRALGKPNEATALYRELVAKNEADAAARAGLVLSLFDAGKRAEAESELAAALARSPGNFPLLAGAAYWYASKGIGDKAVDLAGKALELERRYVWSHIALARGLMAQGNPVAAEQVLVKARAFGNFPTLEYEIASARMAAGFFLEAAEDLAKHFSPTAGGVRTRLGGRVDREEKSLYDLVAYERRASIFEPNGASTKEDAEILRALLELNQKLQAAEPAESEVAAAAAAFVKGTDKMKLHRQLFAASMLLQKRVAIPMVLELARAATGNTDTALEVASPGAAVMASELYESRTAAFRKNEFLLVPDVPKPTLSAILRGRIEEISGWARYQQNDFPGAVIRLRRAITVMPDKSAWWRSSMWRLGAALAADGKDTEALSSYIESYKTDKPDFGKYAVVESLYRKVNGTTDGLEAQIGAERVAIISVLPEITNPATPSETPAVTPAIAPGENSSGAGQVSSPAGTLPEPETGKRSEPAVTVDPVPEVKTEKETRSGVAEPAAPAVQRSDAKVETEVRSEPGVSETDNQKPVPAGDEKARGDVESENAQARTAAGSSEPPGTKPAAAEPSAAPPQTEIVQEKPAEKIAKPLSAETKPLFEPIIINIPRNRPAKPASVTDAENRAAAPGEKRIDETARAASAGAESTGAARPRVIEGREVTVDQPAPCRVRLSQESVSLINDGGNIGILVNLDGPGDIGKLVATSSSQKDIEVTLEPEIGLVSDRRFFVIKSVSPALGVYQVTFAAPCGKKELLVTVR